MQKMKIVFVILVFGFYNSYAQTEHKELYKKAFNEQHQMLKGEIPINFKRAVFITENAYHKGSLNYETFKNEISQTGIMLKNLIRQRGLIGYKTAGNWAVFTYMTDSLPINNYTPCTYDFDDFMGENDWTKMFTTRLMRTRKGNCHSLPYYYKILCEEIGAKASLALAPNHVYIKHIDENGQWTNVELTNGGFPRDQWIIKQMAISVEAIKNEIYMKPLTEKENIAMTMFDLAGAYKFQFEMDSLYLQMIDTALTYFPRCIPLLMCRINYYGNQLKTEKEKPNPNINYIREMFKNQEAAYEMIVKLGHKDMPIEQYEEWVQSVEKEKQKLNQQNK